MFISELKKKNYFRYLQIFSLDSKNKNYFAIIFLFENELNNIFFTCSEAILRKIMFQWFIAEFEKNNSSHKLVENLIKIDKTFNIKKECIEIIQTYQEIDEDIFNFSRCKVFFKKINNLQIKILNKITDEDIGSFKGSYVFMLVYFFYRNGNKLIFAYKELENLYYKSSRKDYDIFESVFIELILKKLKQGKKMKITRFSFILNLIFCKVMK